MNKEKTIEEIKEQVIKVWKDALSKYVGEKPDKDALIKQCNIILDNCRKHGMNIPKEVCAVDVKDENVILSAPFLQD